MINYTAKITYKDNKRHKYILYFFLLCFDINKIIYLNLRIDLTF